MERAQLIALIILDMTCVEIVVESKYSDKALNVTHAMLPISISESVASTPSQLASHSRQFRKDACNPSPRPVFETNRVATMHAVPKPIALDHGFTSTNLI